MEKTEEALSLLIREVYRLNREGNRAVCFSFPGGSFITVYVYKGNRNLADDIILKRGILLNSENSVFKIMDMVKELKKYRK